jgi:REP element-mobilizing transposase RayT
MSTTHRPPFVPFDEHKAVRIYRRNLPHWRQEGATYFVTFRLGDSIPQNVLDQWDFEKQNWLRARGICCQTGQDDWKKQLNQLSDSDRYQFHKHFNRLFQASLDRGHGMCHLQRAECIRILREKLLLRDGGAYHLGDVVVMPNHAHLLLTPSQGEELEMILKGVKGASAKDCNERLGRSGKFWQPDSYDHIVRTLEQLLHFRRYIRDNPKKAGITLAPDALYQADWMDDWFD